MGIRTQTSASSLDQLISPKDLTHHWPAVTSVLNPSTKQAHKMCIVDNVVLKLTMMCSYLVWFWKDSWTKHPHGSDKWQLGAVSYAYDLKDVTSNSINLAKGHFFLQSISVGIAPVGMTHITIIAIDIYVSYLIGRA